MSDNYLKQAQLNAVFLTQEEMDRVGFEPTTSAMPILRVNGYLNVCIVII
ncbi:MAG TPA: hypothetical protein VJ551_01510 [Nitrososphaeraceae archaeon]|nr:hypothetical protein [Nitrososphaeraceae archaeon]